MDITDSFGIDAYRRQWVDNAVSGIIGNDRPRNTELERLMDRATREAADQAVAAGHFPAKSGDRWHTSKFDEYLEGAVDPIRNLYWSFPRGDANRADGRVWSHQPFLLQDVRAKRLPEFQRLDIEQIAGSYIAGKVKTQTTDRLLVDLLVALEFAQYARTIFDAPHVPILAPSVTKQRVIFDWFVGRLIAVILGFVSYGFFWLLSKIGLFPDDWLWVVGVILVGLWFLDAFWGTAMLPKAWLSVRKRKKAILDLLDHMVGTYSALVSEGPISAQHITGLVNKSTEAGVVWPGPLHVLLEDITSRGGRF